MTALPRVRSILSVVSTNINVATGDTLRFVAGTYIDISHATGTNQEQIIIDVDLDETAEITSLDVTGTNVDNRDTFFVWDPDFGSGRVARISPANVDLSAFNNDLTVFLRSDEDDVLYGNIVPSPNQTLHLGTSSNEFKEIWAENFKGTATDAGLLYTTNETGGSNTRTVALGGGGSSGNKAYFFDNNFTYNELTGTLTADTFSGKATHVNIGNTGTNATYYPTFATGNSGSQELKTDSANFTYNPSTNVLTAGTFSGTATEARGEAGWIGVRRVQRAGGFR